MEPLKSGDRLDRYRLDRPLGAGGMGSVWVAVQEGLGRRVALKVMHAGFAADPGISARFRREAEIAASFNHPGIVPVTDFGVHEGQPYLVMDLLEGESMDSLLAREGRLPVERVAFLATQILSALEAAHAKDVVHRDLKPDNVFVTSSSGVQDVARLLDFGIASLTAATGDAKMTSTGQVLGTPAYMAPEQAKGLAVEARSDLYSVGVIMYEALSGQVPFSGTNYHQLMFAIVDETPPPLAELRPDLDPGFVAVIERAMSKKAEDRYESAAAMRAAIAPFARSVPMTANPVASSPLASSPPIGSFGGPAQANSTGTDPLAQTMASGEQLAAATVAPSSRGKTLRMALGGFAALALVGLGAAVALRGDAPALPLADEEGALVDFEHDPAEKGQVPAVETPPAEPAEQTEEPAEALAEEDTAEDADDTEETAETAETAETDDPAEEAVANAEESEPSAPRQHRNRAERTGAPPSMSSHMAARANAGPLGGVMVACGDDGYEHELFPVHPARRTLRATSASTNNNIRPVTEFRERVSTKGDEMARCYAGALFVRGQLITLTLDEAGQVINAAMLHSHGCPIPAAVEQCVESTLRTFNFSDMEHRAGDVRVGLDYRNL